MNILFLGNSLIFYNDMPEIFAALATAAGKEVCVSSITKGSATVSHFASETDPLGVAFREALNERAWDVVIIEPSRRISPFEDSVLEAETAAARTVQALAAQAGAKLLLYAVWGNNDGIVKECVAEAPPHMPFVEPHPYDRTPHALFLHEVSCRISRALGGVSIAPAGYAFENMLAAEDCPELYYEDRRHPSPAGSYRAACTIYATLFGEPTEGIPYTYGLPQATALQKIADQTVLGGLVPRAAQRS